MRKIISTILLMIIFSLVSFAVFAEGDQNADLNPLGCKTFGECFNTIANFLFYIVTGILALSIIVVGILFFTGATPNRIVLAKRVFLWAIGLFVIMMIVKVIAYATKGDLTNLKNLPQETQ